jgi:predicted RNA-binding protein with PUA-like domain
MKLVKLSRLSVSPVSGDEWKTIAKMAGIKG